MSKAKLELRMNRLKVLVKQIWQILPVSAQLLWPIEFYLPEFPRKIVFGVISFRQLFMSYALRKCKKDCKIPKIILVPSFDHYIAKVLDFLDGLI